MVAETKERIMVTLTKEQAKEYTEIAKELGISRSALMQIATMQYVNSYKVTKASVPEVLESVLMKAIEGKQITVNDVMETLKNG